MLWLLARFSYQTPNSGDGISLPLLPDSETLPPIGLSWPALKWGILSCLVVSCFFLFGCQFLESRSLLKWKPSGNGSKEEGRYGELAGFKGREIVFGMLCERRIYFPKKKKKKEGNKEGKKEGEIIYKWVGRNLRIAGVSLFKVLMKIGIPLIMLIIWTGKHDYTKERKSMPNIYQMTKTIYLKVLSTYFTTNITFLHNSCPIIVKRENR